MNSTVVETMRSLRQFGRRAAASLPGCELCNAPMAAEHAHLVESSSGRLLCACEACAILFGHQQGQKYHRVPSSVVELSDFSMSDLLWNNLAVPIGLAFLYESTPAGR